MAGGVKLIISRYKRTDEHNRKVVLKMPELSRFGGMVIYMLFMDTKQHNKPHVHVYYGEYEASIALDGELLAGSIPRKQFKMIVG